MIQLGFSDVRRPRFLLGVLRRRVAVRLRAIGDLDAKVEVDGLRLRIPARDGLVRLIDEEGFEPSERDFLARALRSGDVFVDVGAHAGIHTIPAGLRVGPDGHVYAFEPNTVTYACLQRNVADHDLGGLVTCQNVAISDADGLVELHVPRHGFGPQASLGAIDHRVGPTDAVKVAAATLEQVLVDVPFLVKIDVEGWEAHVIAGGRRLLASEAAPHLLVEFSDLTAAGADATTGDLFNEIEKLGYRLYQYERGGRLIPEPRGRSYGARNLVATKRFDELAGRLSSTEGRR